MRFARRSQAGEDAAAGWISITDYLFLLVVLGIGMSVAEKAKSDAMTAEFNRAVDKANSAESLRVELQRVSAKLKTEVDKNQEFRLLHAKCDPQKMSTLEVELRQRLIEINVKEKELQDLRKSSAEQLVTLTARDKRILQLEAQIQKLNADLLNQQAIARNASRERDGLRKNDVGRKFVGLHENDKRVLFVVDHSESMANALLADGRKGERKRWDIVRSAIKSWITEVPLIEKAALILFSAKVECFPANHTLNDLDVVAANAGGSRGAEFVELLDKSTADGGTDLVTAMDIALKMYIGKIDAIVLFTDGRPTREAGTDARFDQTLCDTILSNLERAKRDWKAAKEDFPRIHVVALGDYFDKAFGKFLIELTTMSGGSFRGW